MVTFSRKKQVIYNPRWVSMLASYGWSRHTWLPDAAPAGSGQPYPEKIWQAHSGSAWSAPILGADPYSCDHLEQEKALEKGREDKTPIISLHAYWVLKWHVILLFIMLFLLIWLMLMLVALDVQNRIGYFCPWLNKEAQMIESVCRMTKNRP